MNARLAVLWKLLAITHGRVPSHAEAGDGCWEEGRAVVARGWSPQEEDPGLQARVCVCT